ncbi:MAG: tryptophan--tRNA ligase [Pseudomonadales bacterium]|uniref:tryptophan--tRNA ligase n=1 Tax=unclassified Ketobacter TaxID=2639109 RepID=UPI000C5EDA52|nr:MULTISPECIES: tryptophan--tRNA ligase [unclassified Ketobacter]MAQ24932.1 tryptophan--tRNA ligase [Pseudomonadales bacterium]MEC8810605.1 tryptophan--tRNA ligase [Pseudomonadota bacterium]TNC89198.1 MAG: tryptophan--tRNA ligase [Alcanivorax sp.]HAG94113.1 tryptophan--tRNA ligase [Gammaproteobacteria bacterium]MBI26782.1 tryptophan--tRNA ligase [Pseudomonadales bacterium]
MSSVVSEQRVLSGMRPTGNLHLGHYHGVLKNWVKLQHEFECFLFVADWHALTTHYEDPRVIEESVWDMVIDWLAAGINPGSATLFIQSRVPEHAELHLLLSMMTPLGWLERVPTYKDQIEQLKEKDLATYGFLGYPLLQSADILIYRAGHVPVGADQVSHIELTREVARRFNHLYGREPGFEELVEQAIQKMGKKTAKLYRNLLNKFQEQGDEEALETAHALVRDQQNITLSDKERLHGFIEGSGKVILTEPQALLTPASKMPGLDGRKMSKSYNNTITLRDSEDEVMTKIRTMPTDPARVRLTDAGDPEKCPVWQWHLVYSDDSTRDWVQQGCKSAGIGCLDCKRPLIDALQEELKPIRMRAGEYAGNPDLVKSIVAEGCEKARDAAKQTLEDVREAMGLGYF